MGEFEKQIDELADSYYEIVLTVPVDNMLKLIAEAKKEFPKDNLTSLFGLIHSVIKKDPNTKLELNSLIELADWFKKWFGK